MAQHYEDKEEQLVIGLQGSPLRASSNDSQEQAALQAESEGKAAASAATNCAQSSSTAPSSPTCTRRHAAKDSENGGMFTDDHWRCLAHAVYVRFAGISCLYMHEMAVPTMAVC